MRYRIAPAFWHRLDRLGISLTHLAVVTPHGRNWVYRLKRQPDSTVSEVWRDGAIALLPEAERQAAAGEFVPVAGSDRYRINAEFWGLLAMRRITCSRLGALIGMPRHRFYLLRRNPWYTIPRDVMDRIVTALGLDGPGLYFSAAEETPSPPPDGHYTGDRLDADRRQRERLPLVS